MKLAWAGCFFLICIWQASSAQAQMPPSAQGTVPVTGKAVPGFEEFDRAVVEVIQRDHIPGAAIAFVKDGRLVYARGFGWANEESRTPIEPTSVFRLASISKSLTGIGILKLIQDKRLCMQQKAFAPPRGAPGNDASGDLCSRPLLHLEPVRCSGCKVDPRLYDITVQDLMQMSGGWITSTEEKENCGVMVKGSGDWGFQFAKTRQVLHLNRMPSRADVIRYGISHKLNFTPGSCFSYANFNFMVLGQIVEEVTGQPYEQWMEQEILHPMGVRNARVGLFRQLLPNEVNYYVVASNGENRRCCFDVLKPPIDSFGGWTANIVDLAHVQASLRNGIPQPNPLTPETMALMVSRPANPQFAGKYSYWTDGWDSVHCEPDAGGPDGCYVKGATWEKGGDFSVGTITTYSSAANGVGYVLLFNSHTPTNMPDINRKLIQPLVRNKTDWPGWDLFQDYR